MKHFRPTIMAAAMLLAAAASAQSQTDDHASFKARDGYEQARFGGEDVTIRTRDGTKTLHVSFDKLRVAQTGKSAAIKLPGQGLALVQHTAGTAKFAARAEKFEPLEGEWLRLPLPAEFTLGTDDDSILLDLILIEERVR
jgi:hypothetical protein